MTTFYTFQPSSVAPFQFAPVLDGTTYNATVTWNLFGQRWYLNIAAADGTVILTKALVPSPVGQALSSVVWDQAQGVVVATSQAPLGLALGNIVNLTITGATPTAYNGSYPCAVQNDTEFTYPIAADPGLAASYGTVEYNINLVNGVFQTSTLVWRADNNQFEVTP